MSYSEISNPPLLIAFAIATYFIIRSSRSPHNPKVKHGKDTIFAIPIVQALAPKFNEIMMLIAASLHMLVTANIEVLGWTRLCPHPDHVNPIYFSGTDYVCVCLTVIFALGPLRLWCYRSLGKNFTFELAKPDRLVTTGIYAYIQHPSYPPLWIIQMTAMMLFLPLDGVLGCWIPLWVILMWQDYKWYLLAAFGQITGLALWYRVREEEEMLKETFGEEWEAWHKKTARFIPGLL